MWPPAAICTPRAKAPEVAAEDDAEDSEDAVTEPDEDGADAEGVAKADADDASKSDASEVAKTDVDVAKSEGSSKADADDAAKSEDASKADADDAAKTEADEDSEEDDSSEEASEAAPKALAPWQRLGCIVGPTKAPLCALGLRCVYGAELPVRSTRCACDSWSQLARSQCGSSNFG